MRARSCIALTLPLLACGLDSRKQAIETAGIDTLMSASDPGGTSSGGGETSSTGAVGDDTGAASAPSDSSSGDSGPSNLPKFDIGGVTGAPMDECMSGPNDDADGDRAEGLGGHGVLSVDDGWIIRDKA